MVELSGLTVRIDTGSLVLDLQGLASTYPEVGERVRLELLLPVNLAQAKAKCLTVRARVTQVKELPDGSRQIGFSFRKAIFKDRVDPGLRKPPKLAVSEWKM
jgi:hypothetical protein